ncbi:MAG TPA: hypothetical protein VG870_09705 [Chitinophagaceae bacterium]|nr:hypothetical protein [Chitinophagaceae bacterium]
MRIKQVLIKVFAVLVLLVFTQRGGLGIYLHNWLHLAASQDPLPPGESRTISFNCHCLEDLAMPFFSGLPG